MSLTALSIITKAIELGASDVHLTVFRPPIYRVNGQIIYDENEEIINLEDSIRLGKRLLPNEKTYQQHY